MARILLVEDEPAIAAGVKDDLELEGYSVDLVTDGAAAAEKGLQGQYDLILLDVMLPKKDGFTICRELRAAGVRAPIVMLTARGQEVDKVVGLELGADDYVTKPFSRRELQARVKAALRRSMMTTDQPAQVYQFGDVKIDFGRCEASRHGKPVELTALELKLLRTFLSRRGQVLTIDQLNQEAWGKDVFITDRVVYTHMNNLRKKIERDPQNPRHLITVRGVGYRFDY
jgi:two-component system alkaline phosphatase synthesis response regulator PhoP